MIVKPIHNMPLAWKNFLAPGAVLVFLILSLVSGAYIINDQSRTLTTALEGQNQRLVEVLDAQAADVGQLLDDQSMRIGRAFQSQADALDALLIRQGDQVATVLTEQTEGVDRVLTGQAEGLSEILAQQEVALTTIREASNQSLQIEETRSLLAQVHGETYRIVAQGTSTSNAFDSAESFNMVEEEGRVQNQIREIRDQLRNLNEVYGHLLSEGSAALFPELINDYRRTARQAAQRASLGNARAQILMIEADIIFRDMLPIVEELKQAIDSNAERVFTASLAEAQAERQRYAREAAETSQAFIDEATTARAAFLASSNAAKDSALAEANATRQEIIDRARASQEAFLTEAEAQKQNAEQASATVARNSAQDARDFLILYLVLGVAGAAFAVLVAVFISRVLTKRIQTLAKAIHMLAEGRTEIEGVDAQYKDEIGEIEQATTVFQANIKEKNRLQKIQQAEQTMREQRAKRRETLTADFDKSISDLIVRLMGAVNDVHSTSDAMLENARQTSSQSVMVSSATAEASENVNAVSVASDQLLSSIQEVSAQMAKAATASQTTVQKADEAERKISSLAQAADRIGQIVTVITDIAEQTNLLALNATIEAARAGDAGKGFAVVASEVKNLASQTGKATEEITEQISSVQAEVNGAVTAIKEIYASVHELNEMATTVASAIEQQGAATNEINSNVQQTAYGTQQISESISGVAEIAEDTGKRAQSVFGYADALRRESDVLKGEVDTFLQEMRSL